LKRLCDCSNQCEIAETTAYFWNFNASQAPPLALIVDHRLREESTVEANLVATRAASIGLRPRVLTIDWGASPPSRRQSMPAARRARYAALLQACQEEGTSHLLTAHHADDQAETFLLRLIHASGVEGLAGIPRQNLSYVMSHGVRIIRPLLSMHKADLESFCKEIELDFVADPTNDDPSFQRNLLRKLLRETCVQEEAEKLERLQSASSALISEEAYGSGGEHVVGKVNAELNFEDAAFNEDQGAIDHSGPSTLVHDILLLQKMCAKASWVMQHRASSFLKRVIMQAATTVSPSVAHPLWFPRRYVRSHPGYEIYYPRRRRRIHWPSHMAALSRELRDIPHVILSVEPFALGDRVTACGAVSRLLQGVSGSEYPPSSSDAGKLAARLSEGQMIGGFTGGACTVHPVVHSRGRYALVVPQRSQKLVQEKLKAARLRGPKPKPDMNVAHRLDPESAETETTCTTPSSFN
jgi:tRNA(Ile)-lysidine synthetase-like protein